VKPLRHLFDMLDKYVTKRTFVVSIFFANMVRCAKEKQLEVLLAKADRLDKGYPFKWPELLAPIVNSCFDAHRPNGLPKDGASSWFSLAGGPEWHGGDLQHPLRRFQDVLPDSELFASANSCLPDEVKWAKVDPQLLSNALQGISKS
jgi:hypothetical protein